MLLGVGLVMALAVTLSVRVEHNGLGQGKHSNGFILRAEMQRLISGQRFT